MEGINVALRQFFFVAFFLLLSGNFFIIIFVVVAKYCRSLNLNENELPTFEKKV